MHSFNTSISPTINSFSKSSLNALFLIYIIFLRSFELRPIYLNLDSLYTIFNISSSYLFNSVVSYLKFVSFIKYKLKKIQVVCR